MPTKVNNTSFTFLIWMLFKEDIVSTCRHSLKCTVIQRKMSAFKALIITLYCSTLCYTKEIPSEKNTFSACITNLITTYFTHASAFITSGDLNLNYQNVKIPYLIINENQVDMLEVISEKYKSLIMQPESTVTLNNTINYMKSTDFFNSRAKYLVLLKHKEEVNETASILWYHNLYKFVIAIRGSEDYAELYSINFKMSKCGKSVFTRKIITCTNGIIENGVSVFPNDISKDFKNCSLTAIWSKEAPWVLDPNSTTDPGVLISVLNLIGIRICGDFPIIF